MDPHERPVVTDANKVAMRAGSTGNHVRYVLIAVDPGSTACGGVNDPQVGGCDVSSFTQPFLGDVNGPSLTLPSIN